MPINQTKKAQKMAVVTYNSHASPRKIKRVLTELLHGLYEDTHATSYYSNKRELDKSS